MIPYVEEPVWQIGPVQLTAFGLLVCGAVALGIEIVLRRAPRIGLERDQASRILFWTVVTGFVTAHVFDVVAYYPEEVRRNPLVLLQVWGSLSSFGGIFGGLVAAFLIMRRMGLERATMVAFVDTVAFAFPFAWVLGRAGCALRHDHMGVPSQHFLAVAFPEGPRFDLGLLEMLFSLGVAGLFLALDRRRWPVPFFFGLFFTLYGPVRFVLDTLRVGDARYLGWTPGQFLAVASTGLGLATLVWALRRGRAADAAPVRPAEP